MAIHTSACLTFLYCLRHRTCNSFRHNATNAKAMVAAPVGGHRYHYHIRAYCIICPLGKTTIKRCWCNTKQTQPMADLYWFFIRIILSVSASPLSNTLRKCKTYTLTRYNFQFCAFELPALFPHCLQGRTGI